MKLTKSYLRKLIKEEILREQQETATTILRMINMGAGKNFVVKCGGKEKNFAVDSKSNNKLEKIGGNVALKVGDNYFMGPFKIETYPEKGNNLVFSCASEYNK